MTVAGGEGPALVPIHILGLPLDVYQRVSEHSDELLREFALIREDGSSQVPDRLLGLVDELTTRFGAFTEGPAASRQAALARGDRQIDLHYEVPAAAADAAVQLGGLLDEADAFCRSGDLLTLATGAEGLAFRRWFLDEFVAQVGGRPPRPWPGVMEGPVAG